MDKENKTEQELEAYTAPPIVGDGPVEISPRGTPIFSTKLRYFLLHIAMLGIGCVSPEFQYNDV